MNARLLVTGKLTTNMICCLHLAKRTNDFPKANEPSSPVQRVPTLHPPDAVDKAGLREHAQELLDVRTGEPLFRRNLFDGHNLALRHPGKLQQTSQAVFFLGGDLHDNLRVQ